MIWGCLWRVFWQWITVFALRFQNLPARNSSLKIFKHEKEEKLAGPKGKFAGPAQFLVAEGLGPALNAKTGITVVWHEHHDISDHLDCLLISLFKLTLKAPHQSPTLLVLCEDVQNTFPLHDKSRLLISYEWYIQCCCNHYSDIIMSPMASPITSLLVVYSTLIQAQIKEKIKALRHWPLWGEFIGDWWIPHTKGQ